jgi:hypothetical protein
MNLLLGVLVFSLLFFQIGVPDYTQVQIGEVMPGSPAAQAGLQKNDIIVTADGKAINDSLQLHDLIYANLDKPIELGLRRGHNPTVTAHRPATVRKARCAGHLHRPRAHSRWVGSTCWLRIARGLRADRLLSCAGATIRGRSAGETFVGLRV